MKLTTRMKDGDSFFVGKVVWRVGGSYTIPNPTGKVDCREFCERQAKLSGGRVVKEGRFIWVEKDEVEL